jgi:triacylglycerol lipase
MRGEKIRRQALAGFIAVAVSSGGAHAQMSANPPEVAKKVEALGRTLNPAVISATKAIFASLQPKPPFSNVSFHRNLSYGSDPRNRLDLFAPHPLPKEARAVLIFVHGVSFTGGDKSGPPNGTFYDNIGVWLASRGLIGITINYRLAPDHPWPAAIEDIGKAVHWAIQNVAPYGGDPDRIFLMGHSAGATHVADYVSHPDLQPAFGAGVKGAILLSGLYDLAGEPLRDNEKAYFGNDPALYSERSAIKGLVESKLPLFVAFSEFDLPRMEQQGRMLNKAGCEKMRCPQFLVLPKHSHMSEIYSIGTADKALSNAILGFIKAH